ncbi:MAG: response regulator transcription factor [Clostridiales bacterium]|jgi:DNA-binding response OmpR family regulator|nr:response regulator transcription factor [Clostridiales bacterium]
MADPAKILIIEDDSDISRMLEEFLGKSGYLTGVSANGLDGLKKASSGHFDLALLDLSLPYKSGDELLRELRMTSGMPVIVVSAKSLTRDKIELLQLGADDYMVKPFDLDELLARIEANLRRASKAIKETSAHWKNVSLDSWGKTVLANGAALKLTAKEYAMLELLMQNPKKVFSKKNLYESVWEEQYAYDNDIINTHVSNIRKKLKDASCEDCIETVWGIGYRLKPEAE